MCRTSPEILGAVVKGTPLSFDSPEASRPLPLATVLAVGVPGSDCFAAVGAVAEPEGGLVSARPAWEEDNSPAMCARLDDRHLAVAWTLLCELLTCAVVCMISKPGDVGNEVGPAAIAFGFSLLAVSLLIIGAVLCRRRSAPTARGPEVVFDSVGPARQDPCSGERA